MKAPKIVESDLAKVIIRYLESHQWEIYQEVEGCGGRADIVAKRDNIQWAIECKTSFGFPVIEQAFNWRGRSHYTSVAVPNRVSSFGQMICKQNGIGILTVDIYRMNVDRYDSVIEKVKPTLFRKAKGFKLYEEQKTWSEAGSQAGGHFTPFKRTVQTLINTVHRQPNGCEFSKLIKELDHHYSSSTTAKSCLKKFIGTDVIPQLEFRTVDGKLLVFKKE